MAQLTFRPHVAKRYRRHGFRRRMRTGAGRKVLVRRRARGRWRLSVAGGPGRK